MDDELLAAVLARASADEKLPEESKLLVLDAFTGGAELMRAPNGDRPSLPAPAGDQEGRKTALRWLAGITVEGYRGIGPRTSLTFTPGPGLVLVSGRNGSGKSSFAEALEVALTGKSYRWSDERLTLRPRWRNLKLPGNTSIQVDLAEEGWGKTTVAANWAADAQLADVNSWVQKRGEKRQQGLGALGWAGDVELFRPFLAYEELESLLAKKSKLHSALDSILGLERLDGALDLLERTHRDLAASKTQADRLKPQVYAMLSASEDERAKRAAEQLKRYGRPNLDVIASLVTGDVSDDGGAAALRQVAELQVRPMERFSELADRVRLAEAELATLERSADESVHRRLELLRSAVRLHAENGDGPCPVCGVGDLDQGWSVRVRQELEAADALSAGTKDARDALEQAWRSLTSMREPPPQPLRRVALEGLPGAAEAVTRWESWSALTRAELLEDGLSTLKELTVLMAGVSAAALELADERQSTWKPMALDLGDWLRHAQHAQDSEERVKEFKQARDWLRKHGDDLRNDRVRPLADRARRVWSLLRQESNVDLGEITLTGRANRRTVTMTASVNGETAGALEVMSQGEVNALALSLFIPKGSLPESPFGFMVIDDPVQAMDPAKVDGLAQVLCEFAADRQVIVFTHDDRLADAVRRMRIPARLVEITRDGGSKMTIAESDDPATRYLSDARAVAKDPRIPEDVRRYVVAEMCRMGLEARCRDLYYGAQFTSGAARNDVEKAWKAAERTREKVALTLGRPESDLRAWEQRGQTRDRSAAMRICTSDSHAGTLVSPPDAVKFVGRLLEDLQRELGTTSAR